MSDGPIDGLACETCLFWQPRRSAMPANTLGFDPPRTGRCMRYPPTTLLTAEGPRTFHTLVARDNWCGEHVAKEDR